MDCTVENYFSILRGIWEELSHYHPLPTVNDQRECTEHQRIYDLLRGLNLEYEQTWAYIQLGFHNYLGAGFSLIQREESH